MKASTFFDKYKDSDKYKNHDESVDSNVESIIEPIRKKIRREDSLSDQDISSKGSDKNNLLATIANLMNFEIMRCFNQGKPMSSPHLSPYHSDERLMSNFPGRIGQNDENDDIFSNSQQSCESQNSSSDICSSNSTASTPILSGMNPSESLLSLSHPSFSSFSSFSSYSPSSSNYFSTSLPSFSSSLSRTWSNPSTGTPLVSSHKRTSSLKDIFGAVTK